MALRLFFLPSPHASSCDVLRTRSAVDPATNSDVVAGSLPAPADDGRAASEVYAACRSMMNLKLASLRVGRCRWGERSIAPCEPFPAKREKYNVMIERSQSMRKMLLTANRHRPQSTPD